MLDDIEAIDIAAILWLLVVWGSYNLIMDRVLSRRVGLNQYMRDVRRDWMLVLLRRQLLSCAIRGPQDALARPEP